MLAGCTGAGKTFFGHTGWAGSRGRCGLPLCGLAALPVRSRERNKPPFV